MSVSDTDRLHGKVGKAVGGGALRTEKSALTAHYTVGKLQLHAVEGGDMRVDGKRLVEQDTESTGIISPASSMTEKGIPA